MIKTNVLKFKKAVAVFMAMLLMMLSFSYTANDNSDAANSSRTYKVYNATNGNYLRSYTLTPLNTSDNSRGIIDTDERVIDWTKSGVVKIIDTDTSIGSGFVVDEHTIATAAHCVYDYDKYENGPSSVSEVLLFDTNGNIEQTVTPIEYHVPINFINVADNGKYSPTFDYALITVKEDLSEYMCFELGVPLDSFVNGETNATVSVTGFPEYINKTNLVNTTDKHMMYTGNGKVCGGDTEGYFLRHMADVSNGNSGGPVYITESLQGRTYYTVVAIHTNGLSDYGWGTRMTTDLIHFYKSNSNLNY